MSATVHWPEKYTPGTTDNFVSNEVIVQGLLLADIWSNLTDVSKWPTYYWNCSDITPPADGNTLKKGSQFSFATFGIGPFPVEVFEALPPTVAQPGRLAWRGWIEGDADTAMDIYHAWIVESLPGGRVRIVTQESQIGKPAAALAIKRPNPMLICHQDWLDSLVSAARGKPDTSIRSL